MPLQFISHKEITFRQLLGMLRVPPYAMLSYYSNLFLMAKMVLIDEPEKVRYLDKEIRRVECMVGVVRTAVSTQIQRKIRELGQEKAVLEADLLRITSMFDSAEKEMKEELIETHEQVLKKTARIDAQEHYLLFKLTPKYNLKMIEQHTDNNIDLLSFFKEDGVKITQLQLVSELDNIKLWIYQNVAQRMKYVRFTKLE